MSLYLNIIMRGVITFLLLILFFRMMGPRQLIQFTFKDYVLGVLVGSMGGRAITRPEQAYSTFFCGIATIIIMQMLLFYLCLRSDRVRRFANGEPIIVIENGQILRHNLKKAKLSMNELASLLRGKDIFNLCDVEFAILEPTRGFSVMLKSEKNPVKLEDLNIGAFSKELPILAVKDGRLITEELRKFHISENWVKEELSKNNIHDISQVVLAQVNKNGVVYICLKDNSNSDPKCFYS